MNTHRHLLETLFHNISPNIVIQYLIKSQKGDPKNLSTDFVKLFHDSIVQHLLECHPTSSVDEREQMYRILLQEVSEVKDKRTGDLFSIITNFTDKVLTEISYKPHCKYHQLMRWRMVTLKLDEDLFTCAFLAKEDFNLSKKRSNFIWEPIIKTDNIRLHNMLKEGIAENHFHLFGSAPHVQISWINLMNKITRREQEFKGSGMIDNSLDEGRYYSDSEVKKSDSIHMLVVKAAIIRLFIFESLYLKEEFRSLKKNEIEKVLLLDEEHLILEIERYQSSIAFYRQDAFVFNGDKGSGKIDYVLTDSIAKSNMNHNLFLCSERKLLYDAFYKIFSHDKSFEDIKHLLYIYLLIKSKFRNQMIQSNDRHGFKNFSDFQGRKDAFLQNDRIFMEALAFMAVESSCKDQNIKSLEARITPSNNSEMLNSRVLGIDSVITTAKNIFEKGFYQSKYDRYLKKLSEDGNHSLDTDDTMFYVIHMPKNIDKKSIGLIDKYNEITDVQKQSKHKFDYELKLRIRDSEVRKRAKNTYIQISDVRERYKYSAFRIYGIDACSNEIGCRPEVFSQSIRAIRNHMNKNQKDIHHIYYLEDALVDVPDIKVTYHAGEDFLDVVDGLRAVDESIIHCNMRHGDRLGHALALGIDVEDWYRCKNYKVSINNQDYLDNLAWMIRKVIDYKIDIDIFLFEELKDEFKKSLVEVYSDNIYEINDNKVVISSVDFGKYYESMLLRGDLPNLYSEGKFDETDFNEDSFIYWHHHSINRNIVKGKDIRNSVVAPFLYYLYHYDFDVRRKGMIVKEHCISKRLVKLVSDIQKKMQIDIRNKGIGIECNPSSNYLIGSFKRYDKHPIINFYNLGLTHDYKSECPQMFVSINTDDQGVFGTYLENEYALMALSLEKATDQDGNKIYNPEMIYRWLDSIRIMGLQQSFKLKSS